MKAISALIFIVLFFYCSNSFAQEIDCKIKMNTEQLTAEARENIADFDRKIEEYINSFRWTKDDFGSEKIKCSIDIFFQGSPATNRYVAQVFIGSQRPIYKSDKNTGVIRILDDKWEFTFYRNQSLYHNNLQYDPVTSFMDFYIYTIIGFDYDSYKSLDGTPFFQQALDIAGKAQSGGGGSSGWELKASGAYNRAKFIEEVMNPRYKLFREAFYVYHYKGLDLFYKNKTKGQENILKAMESLGSFQKKINERSIVIKTFLDTKYLELCEIFLDFNDPLIYQKLIAIDPSHQKNYEEYQLKKR